LRRLIIFFEEELFLRCFFIAFAFLSADDAYTSSVGGLTKPALTGVEPACVQLCFQRFRKARQYRAISFILSQSIQLSLSQELLQLAVERAVR
jgi:hypothetical protein